MSKLSVKNPPEKPIILVEGQSFRVECAIRKNYDCPSEDFLDSLDISEKAKILKVIKRFADFGKIYNKEKFKKLEGVIWEFKDRQLRVLMYHCARGCIALTHGFKKKARKIPREEIEKALNILNEYEEIRKGWQR